MNEPQTPETRTENADIALARREFVARLARAAMLPAVVTALAGKAKAQVASG